MAVLEFNRSVDIEETRRAAKESGLHAAAEILCDPIDVPDRVVHGCMEVMASGTVQATMDSLGVQGMMPVMALIANEYYTTAIATTIWLAYSNGFRAGAILGGTDERK